jgi:hypothetical protein
MRLAKRTTLSQPGYVPSRRQVKRHRVRDFGAQGIYGGASGLPYSQGMASCGSIQIMVAALLRAARKPNPSVNLTRNSAPRWPSEARYAHNAPLVHRVALPRAGYLKR